MVEATFQPRHHRQNAQWDVCVSCLQIQCSPQTILALFNIYFPILCFAEKLICRGCYRLVDKHLSLEVPCEWCSCAADTVLSAEDTLEASVKMA